MSKLEKWLEWWNQWGHASLAILGTVIAFAGAYWGSYAEANEDPWKIFGLTISWQALGFIVGLLGAGMAAVIPIRDARAHTQAITALNFDLDAAKDATDRAIADGAEKVDLAKIEGRADFLFIVDFVLLPLVRKLGKLSRMPRGSARNELAVELRTHALNALKEVIDPSIPRLRVNYYTLEFGIHDQPYLQHAAGTATPSRPRFDLSFQNDEADALMDMLARGSYIFTADCENDPPAGFNVKRARTYETFISAAAVDGTEVVGMLTVDSPEAGSLTEADAVLVQLIATLVAIADGVTKGKRDASVS